MENMEDRMIDYIDGTLDESRRHEVEAEITSNPEARRRFEQLKQLMRTMDTAPEWTPSSGLQTKFEASLKKEKVTGKIIFLRPAFLRIAAVFAVLIVVAGIAFVVNREIQRDREMMALRSRLEETERLVLRNMQNQSSAGERILGVKATYEVSAPSDEIVTALIQTMNADPNANVRLAAIHALARCEKVSGVRKALLSALVAEQDPVVQIGLINVLVALHEKAALEPLQHIINDHNTLDVVKDEAYAGIFRLS